MQSILSPVIRIISRMKYGQKFILLSVLFLIPLTMVMILWIKDISEEIKDTQSERTGVQYVQNVIPLMLDIQRHRGLANGYLNGDKASMGKMETAREEITDAIASLDKVQAEMEDADGTGKVWLERKQEWEKLKSETASLTPADSFSRHSMLVDNLMRLISLAADQSGLRLDPEIDTTYLIDAVTDQIPVMMESAAQTRGQGNGILQRKKQTEDERLHLMTGLRVMENELTGLERSLNVVMDMNETSASRLREMEKQAADALIVYLGMLDAEFLKPGAALGMKPDVFFAQATTAIEQMNGLFAAVSEELDLLLEERLGELAAERNVLLIVLAVTLLLAAAVFIAFYYNVVHTIRELQKEASRISSGDLSREVKLQTRDELARIGDSFNEIQGAMNSLLRRNQEISEQVSVSSGELSNVSMESTQAMRQIAEAVGSIAEGAEIQQSGAAENSLALHEMAEGVSRIAEASGEVVHSASQAAASAVAGADKLREAVAQMQQVQLSAAHSGAAVRALGERSKQIDELTGIILGIASQTQLLSLNANIEAARAGEAGRGFAVVATEVAKLAEQSRQSVGHISGVLSEIGTLVQQAQEAMDQTNADAEQGLRMVGQADDEILSMKHAIQEVTGQIEEVSAAAEQLSAGTEQVSASFSESASISRKAADEAATMAAATEQQLASMEEVQAAADRLNEQAARLRAELSRFILSE